MDAMKARLAMMDDIAHTNPEMKAKQTAHRQRVDEIKSRFRPGDSDSPEQQEAELALEDERYARELGIDDTEHQRRQAVPEPVADDTQPQRHGDTRPLKPLTHLSPYKMSAGPAELTIAGQPSKLFRKELIRVGHYEKQSDGLSFDVTPALLRHWSLTAKKFLANGNKIPMPATHTDDPEANRGWVEEIFNDGRSLFGLCRFIGDDAIRMAGRSDVSIYSPAEAVDGKGNRYVRPILHVALCLDPVIGSLKPFEAIAASLGTGDPACMRSLSTGLAIAASIGIY